MILEGFKTLRFNAVEQYPHCGLLWALVTQQRVGMSLLHRKLIDLLPKMCPEDDVGSEDCKRKQGYFRFLKTIDFTTTDQSRIKYTLRLELLICATRFTWHIKHMMCADLKIIYLLCTTSIDARCFADEKLRVGNILLHIGKHYGFLLPNDENVQGSM